MGRAIQDFHEAKEELHLYRYRDTTSRRDMHKERLPSSFVIGIALLKGQVKDPVANETASIFRQLYIVLVAKISCKGT